MANYQDLDRVFRALADPTRRAVVRRLCRGPASVTELAGPFDMKLPTFMKHLSVLERGGIVRTEKVGRVRTCELRTEKLAEAERWINRHRAQWESRLDRLEAFLNQSTEDGAS